MNKVTTISQRILQAHCQSRTSQSTAQSFVKELANPTHNRLTNRTKEEHRTDNRRLAQWRVTWLIEHSTSHQLLWCIDSFVLRNPPLRQAPKRYAQAEKRQRHSKLTMKMEY